MTWTRFKRTWKTASPHPYLFYLRLLELIGKKAKCSESSDREDI